MHPFDKEAIDQIDAAVFSGDTFHNPDDHKTLSEMLDRWKRELATVWFSIEDANPEPGQPIMAAIEYMGRKQTVPGCRSKDEPHVVLYDFYSGTGASIIIEWQPRELPNKDDAHPWQGIENKGIG